MNFNIFVFFLLLLLVPTNSHSGSELERCKQRCENESFVCKMGCISKQNNNYCLDDCSFEQDSCISDCNEDAEEESDSASAGEKRGEKVWADGGNLRYNGPYKSEVRRLLSKSPTRWQTPTCLTCNDGIPPQIPSEMPCMRDKYVYAALTYAWAAESYIRVGETDKATSAAKSMFGELQKADSLCSDAPGISGAQPCLTLEMWTCR